jgi:hypothetical protein
MAYSFGTPTKQTVTAGDRVFTVVTVSETGITGASDEWSVSGLPLVGTVTEVDHVLTPGAGTASTSDPRISETTGNADVFDNGTPAASIRDTSNHRFTVLDGKLYGSARANGSADSAVTRITIAHGHQ